MRKSKKVLFVILKIIESIKKVKSEDRLREVEKQHGNHSKMSLLIFFGNHKAENCAIW
jgi:hypothetical protein